MATVFRPTFVAQRSLLRAFSNLRKNRNWRLRSPWSDSYQCVAWAACHTDRKWWPYHHSEFYWPPNLPRITPSPFSSLPPPTPVDYLVQGFVTLGYARCVRRDFEFGYQKVAIYANDGGATHMARQHFFSNVWLSKPGYLEDIIHEDLRDIEGDMEITAGTYGEVAQVLKRSWWYAITNACVFRCVWHSLKFGFLRMWWHVLKLKWRLKPLKSSR